MGYKSKGAVLVIDLGICKVHTLNREKERR